jgi:Replication-relaxation
MAGKGVVRPKRERISYVDERILGALLELHYLTAEQLARLYYKATSLNYVREQLKRLYDTDYLDRIYGPRAQAAGSVPWVYLLGRKGLRHFKDSGVDLDRRYRPSEERAHSDQFLFHTLAINDVLIAARLLAHQRADVELIAIRHDLDLKHTPVNVETAGGQGRDRERTPVVPDGWVDFRISMPGREKPVPAPLLLEVDRNTKAVRAFKRKIRALIPYLTGPYEKMFGMKAVTVAFILDEAACGSARDAEKRLRDMVRWTEEELRDRNKQSWGRIFLFTTLPTDRSFDPPQFFIGARCVTPFSDLPISLLDLPATERTGQPSGTSKALGVSIP